MTQYNEKPIDAQRTEDDIKSKRDILKQLDTDISIFEEGCKQWQELLNDTRYKGPISIFTAELARLTEYRKSIKYIAKDNDEYFRLVIEYDAKIEQLQDILNTPQKFSVNHKELKEQREKVKKTLNYRGGRE